MAATTTVEGGVLRRGPQPEGRVRQFGQMAGRQLATIRDAGSSVIQISRLALCGAVQTGLYVGGRAAITAGSWNALMQGGTWRLDGFRIQLSAPIASKSCAGVWQAIFGGCKAADVLEPVAKLVKENVDLDALAHFAGEELVSIAAIGYLRSVEGTKGRREAAISMTPVLVAEMTNVTAPWMGNCSKPKTTPTGECVVFERGIATGSFPKLFLARIATVIYLAYMILKCLDIIQRPWGATGVRRSTSSPTGRSAGDSRSFTNTHCNKTDAVQRAANAAHQRVKRTQNKLD